MPVKVVRVTAPGGLGEAPHWCADSKCLYYVDVISKTIHRYEPATGETTTAHLDEMVSLIVPVSGRRGEFVVSPGRRLERIAWDGVSPQVEHLEVLAEVDTEPGKEANHFNDGKADPRGRLWAGTARSGCPEHPFGFAPRQGSLFSWSRAEGVACLATDVTLTNGMAWSDDAKTVYYIDSLQHRVDAFDCDIGKPTLSNRRPVFDTKAHGLDGLLDGMTIDAAGNLWVAVFRGGQLLNIDPRSGKLLRTVPMPVPIPTSVAFGGTNLDELYVTTASYMMSDEELKTSPEAGATFRVTGLGVKGLPMHNVTL